MGTWGTAIYSNDTAEDVRDACREVFSFYELKEGNEKIFESFKEILKQEFIDNDYASFWYALADWQWKHGLLTEQVKNKTLELLSVYAGIDCWQEIGNKKDIVRRKGVLDSLKKRLQEPQLPLRKPKITIAKSKHKPGDIISFQANAFFGEESPWKINSFSVPLMFKKQKISNSEYSDIVGFDANGKYMAILCIGTEKMPHSEYVPDVFDEYSVYVWYDYLSEINPTIDTLNSCGFLPLVDWQLKDFNKNITEYINWTYSFTLMTEKFKNSDEVANIIKLNSSSEVDRFYRLFSKKSYSEFALWGLDLMQMFNNAFMEKNRMELLGESVDNLLNLEATNPAFLSPSEVDKAHEKFINSSIL